MTSPRDLDEWTSEEVYSDGGVRVVIQTPRTDPCPQCGEPLPPSRGGRPRRYCSRRCSALASYHRRRRASRGAWALWVSWQDEAAL